MSELIDRERFSADMRDFQNRVGIWRDEAEDTETWTRADAALATIIETKLILDKQPTIAAPRWVRCEDDMPKEDGAYAVGWLYPSGCFYWCKLLFLNGEWQVIDVPEPDYWMPIEPPKEDA